MSTSTRTRAPAARHHERRRPSVVAAVLAAVAVAVTFGLLLSEAGAAPALAVVGVAGMLGCLLGGYRTLRPGRLPPRQR